MQLQYNMEAGDAVFAGAVCLVGHQALLGVIAIRDAVWCAVDGVYGVGAFSPGWGGRHCGDRCGQWNEARTIPNNLEWHIDIELSALAYVGFRRRLLDYCRGWYIIEWRIETAIGDTPRVYSGADSACCRATLCRT